MFIFDTPAHRCREPELEARQAAGGADWAAMLPWIPRERGYPSQCSVIAPTNQLAFLNQAS